MELVPHLSEDYLEKRAEFRRVLTGVLSERNRWNQCIDYTNKKLGMAVGAMFIRDNFNQESKEVALEMIHTLREAFIDTLDEIEWMDEETRQVAREKALAMNERIGYPDMLTQPDLLAEEYASLNFTDSHFQNILNIKRYEAEYNLNKLRQPVSKDKWSTEPAVVNAFYNPNMNDIVFPAGILQPLFYSSQFPKSLNVRHPQKSCSSIQINPFVLVFSVRRDRCSDWSRNHARLRRQGPPIRQGRQPETVVE